MNILLLDYDGFIAKAFYAGYDKEKPGDFEECIKCLRNLEEYATENAEMFFTDEDFIVKKIVSGHTLKKDIYPSYKCSRKQDDNLGLFREFIKKNEDVIIAEHEEADDLIIRLNEANRNNSLVISDDKDLHKYCKWTCKLNQEFVPNKEHFSIEEQLIQLIAGDSTDGIKGVPNIGEYKAKKYLKNVGYSFENVIKLYKESNISIDECAKNIILVHPIARGVLNPDIEINSVYDIIKEISTRIKEVYYNEEKTDNKE